MALDAGARFGSYEILSTLGSGGMGEVYRARDPKLNREVALKILPEAFTGDPDRLARFKREAHVLAALNHPNVAAIHGFEESSGIQALVLELVEGPTLADRIAAGRLPIDEALPIAKQIAEALEAAHEQGIIHRDLKPANIKLRQDGAVKVLDFGLAKAIEPVSGMSASATMSPTITSPAMTQLGVILGTAAYMSPEQAKGRAADRRSDIWAFGCVLYEMLAGKRAFGGDDVSETLAAVLRAEPDWSALPHNTPPRIRRLLQRSVNRDIKQRLQAIGEARITIDAPEEERRPVTVRWWPWAVALAASIVLAAAGWLRSSAPVAQPLMRFTVELPPGRDVPAVGGSVVAISPDATRLAVIYQDESGRRRLNMRRMDETDFAPLPGTDEALYPFFSPDGQWIGFFADGKLKKIPSQGGPLATLCDAPDPRGASWGDDGNIIFAFNGGRSGLSRIPSGGGTPAPVTAPGMEKGKNVSNPHVLPGSKAVVFTSLAAGGNPDEASVNILTFETGQQKTLQQPGFFGRYVPSGHLIYVREATLYAAPFDAVALTVRGASQPVLEDVRLAGLSAAAVLDVSRTGTLVYLTGSELLSRGLFLVDNTGKLAPVHPSPAYYTTPRFSPNGNRVAFAGGSPRNLDLWVKDVGENRALRLTRMPGSNHHPVWTPDGAYLIFESVLGSSQALYWTRSDGGGEVRQLTKDNIRRVPFSFSPDGKWLGYSQQAAGGLGELWIAPIDRRDDEASLGQPQLLLRSPTFLLGPQFSPDGRWIAYESNETGASEVYVTRFPGPRSKFPVSSGGGRYPMWSRNGRELFFLSADGHIMSTSYTSDENTFSAGKPSVWSELRLPRLPSQGYDLAPDGKHIVAVLDAAATAERDNVTVLLNFFDELRRRVPRDAK